MIGCAGTDPFAVADDGFDISSCSVPQVELFLCGPARDGIPALNDSNIVPASDLPASLVTGRVLGVEMNGEARAYPLTVLWWHEIVNDTLGGEPIVVSYCPLTGSGLAFDPRVNGEVLNFGVSGVLFENNLVMFDRQSESLWSQLGVSGICGAARDQQLNRLPVVETATWWWVALHPNATVVTQNTGHARPYGVYPYGTYNSPTKRHASVPQLAVQRCTASQGPRTWSRRGGCRRRLALQRTGAEREHRGAERHARSPADRDRQYVEGGMARAFDRTVDGQVLTLRINEFNTPTLIDAETGSTWSVQGQATAGPLAGMRLEPLEDAYVVFWFAWSVFHPDTRLFDNPIGGSAALQDD